MCLVLRALWGGSACLFVVWLRESRDGRRERGMYLTGREPQAPRRHTQTQQRVPQQPHNKMDDNEEEEPKKAQGRGRKSNLEATTDFTTATRRTKNSQTDTHATRAGLTNTTAAWGRGRVNTSRARGGGGEPGRRKAR